MNQFLVERHFMKERLDLGIDVHPSDADAKQFQKLAKEIDPARHFTIYGCQSCINSLVKFVFDNQKTIIKKQTFPKQDAQNTSEETQY